MARATGWAVLTVLGLSLGACSVGSNKSADEMVASDVPRPAQNTPHDPLPPAPAAEALGPSVPPPVTTAPAAATNSNIPAAPAEVGRGGSSIRFGIKPVYGGDEPGVIIEEVYAETSADFAGLTPGDRMTKWNGEDIEDVEGWMPFLADARPGDKVIITFVRDGKEMQTEVTLKARD